MRALLLMMLAGALGTGARYGLTLWIQHGPGALFDFPLDTLVINVVGCLILSLVTTLALQFAVLLDARLVSGTVFCDAFTTFSTFELEADELVRRAPNLAFLYLSGNLMPGFAAIFAGRWLTLQITGRVGT